MNAWVASKAAVSAFVILNDNLALHLLHPFAILAAALDRLKLSP